MTAQMSRKKSAKFVAGIVAILVLAGCSSTGGGGASSDQPTLERLKEAGSIRVGFANEPPPAYINPDGSLTGVEVEVLREVAAGLGIETLDGVITPFESMIPGLIAGRWDVIAAGLNMKQSRCEQTLFSEPIIVSLQAFAVQEGNPKNITSLADVASNPSIMISTIAGSIEESLLLNAGVPKAQISYFPDTPGGLDAIAAGRADAYMAPHGALAIVSKNIDGIEVTSPLPDAPVVGSGVVFRKEDKVFRDAFNEGLAALKKTPRFGEILGQWGFNAKDLEGVTSEELCKIPG